MKNVLLLGAFLSLFSIVGRAQMAPDAAEEAARRDFSSRMGVLKDRADWKALRENGIEWQKSHPTDANGWFTEGRGAYFMGDVDAAIAAWEKAGQVSPALKENADSWLEPARTIKANFPDIAIKPVEFQIGDSTASAEVWRKKGLQLLTARSYDEIEKVAAELQKSNAGNLKGTPFLSTFFAGFGPEKGKFSVRQAQIAAWRTARPKSNLAQLAAIQLWTDAAWEARGTGYADTITPEMDAKIEVCLQKGAAILGKLPKSGFASPLAYEISLDWGLLSGMGRPLLDSVFQEGIKKFPNYMPLYFRRAVHLLPRWFGEEGEWQKMATLRADKLNGEAGTIFYGRILWEVSERVTELNPNSFDYGRAQQGLRTLNEKNPQSVSALSARLRLAYITKDWRTAQTLLTSPRGHIFDSSSWLWKSAKNQMAFSQNRMNILAQKVG